MRVSECPPNVTPAHTLPPLSLTPDRYRTAASCNIALLNARPIIGIVRIHIVFSRSKNRRTSCASRLIKNEIRYLGVGAQQRHVRRAGIAWMLVKGVERRKRILCTVYSFKVDF